MSNVIPMPIKDQDVLEGVIERVGGLSELLLMFIHNDDTDLQRLDRLALTVLYHGLTEEAEKLTAHVAERRVGTAVPTSAFGVANSASGETGGQGA